MGGGRDFAGQRIYSVKTVNGKRIYTRVRPYKIKQYKGDVETDLLDAWDGYGSEEKILKKLGLDSKLSFGDGNKVSKRTRDMVVLGIAKMAAKYGTDVLTDVEYDDADGTFSEYALAHAHVVGDQGTINLNPRQYTSINDVYRAADHRTSERSGFHPAGYDDDMVAMHEYAHLLQRKLVKLATNSIDDEMAKLDTDDVWDFKDLHDSVFDGTLKGDARRNAIIRMTEIRQRDPDIDFKSQRISQLEEMRNIRHPDVMNQSFQIMKLFEKAGANNPMEVAMKLTGNTNAYASKNWQEAHAECVADYMKNGENARPISIAYVREMDKLLGLRS